MSQAKRVIRDPRCCEHFAQCVEEVPEVFELDAQGFMVVAQEVVSGPLLDRVARAADLCPRQALSLVDEKPGC